MIEINEDSKKQFNLKNSTKVKLKNEKDVMRVIE